MVWEYIYIGFFYDHKNIFQLIETENDKFVRISQQKFNNKFVNYIYTYINFKCKNIRLIKHLNIRDVVLVI